MATSQWSIGLNVLTAGTTEADHLYWRFCEIAKELRPKGYNYVSVTSSKLDEEVEVVEPEKFIDGEYADANTLPKVLAALMETLSEEQARDALTSMQNAGILFRERR